MTGVEFFLVNDFAKDLPDSYENELTGMIKELNGEGVSIIYLSCRLEFLKNFKLVYLKDDPAVPFWQKDPSAEPESSLFIKKTPKEVQ
ncbi:MAG: hypothetical protein GY950_18505 [bacterium]|nr:hypothetical protein [bacterium]